MTVKVTPADVTDCDAARDMLPELRKHNPDLSWRQERCLTCFRQFLGR
ncbi:hypothetical protein GCM10010112_84930 [Actinoplanes lobatus]|uniref:Uncharacterized protein n=1 Tax=Actinoplanes lobatus TaxID=113568 RepID=A0A7W7MJ93_9ACTN|nr:hypothetical protein [Actinoplanes lobatus]GGN95051.1 hypothetical protein GCM10010112_84930 [Actinoplanes lobatus]GIE46110.1 hypothetical protein Alo02nite_90080 [Actinoplanes lobatus]